MSELSDAEKLYQVVKEVLAVCPDCGYEWGGCVCYKNSDAFWEDIRASWDRWLNELYSDEPDSPFLSFVADNTPPPAESKET